MQELPAPHHGIRANPGGPELPGDARGAERPDRRQVLAAGAFGVTALVLPTSLAAASPDLDVAGGLAAPTSVTAQPIGYVSAGSTGGIRVAWSPVTGAGSYEVRWSLVSVNGPYTDGTVTTSDTTVDLTGLPGTDTAHHVVVAAISGSTRSLDSVPVSSSRVIATGGTVTTFVGNGMTGTDNVRYVVHSFTTVGASTFTLNRSIDAEHLIVAGGGGGGSRHGGGGGAGGLLTNVGSAQARAAQAWTVVVGAGGAGVVEQLGNVATFATPSPGGPSSVFGVEAIGGGRGGSVGHGAGGAGGSGGGAQSAGVSSGSGETGQGNAGGAGRDTQWAGGGGGGAGAAGSAAGSNVGGKGGDGASNSITGSPVTYAGGGGGASSTAGSGGSGGGGPGGGGAVRSSGAGSDGAPNTGGGGGAGNRDESMNPNVNFKGGAGGSGIVIVRYPLPA